jgi:REP element-mobilizing transposase RayT
MSLKEHGPMPYWQLFYHLVWATKNREPLLTPDIEPEVKSSIRRKAVGLGAKAFALDGTVDHIHMVAAIPPGIAVATFVGKVKAVASNRFNKAHSDSLLYWQEGYGALSLDAKRLSNCIAYVERQKEHHSRDEVIPLLERAAGDVNSVHE